MKTASSLSRIWEHMKKKGVGFGIVTSCRKDDADGNPLSLRENLKGFINIKKLIRSKGYGYIELIGYWDNDSATEFGEERSLFIPNKRFDNEPSEIDELRSLMTYISNKFDQDGYIFGDGESIYLVDKYGRIFETFKDFNPNNLGVAFSTLKKGPKNRSFHFALTSPTSWIDAHKRNMAGEIWTFKRYKRFIESGTTVLDNTKENRNRIHNKIREALSMPRDKAIVKLSELEKPINKHIVKVLLYGNASPSWIGDIGSRLLDVQEITVEGSKKRLKKGTYYQILFEYPIGEDNKDIRFFQNRLDLLKWEMDDGVSKPIKPIYDKITSKLAAELWDKMEEFYKIIDPLIATGSLTVSKIKTLISTHIL